VTFRSPTRLNAVAAGGKSHADNMLMNVLAVLVGVSVCLHMQGSVSKHAVTSAEFFQRYPPLHAFLLEQLRAAAAQLDRRDDGGVRSAHPSLHPVLVLLSRLRCCSTPPPPQFAIVARPHLQVRSGHTRACCTSLDNYCPFSKDSKDPSLECSRS
jgi:hypothetical protein